MYVGKNGQCCFRLIAKNGQNILSSEGYSSKAACRGEVESVKKNAPQDERYECKEAKSGKYRFVLTAPQWPGHRLRPDVCLGPNLQARYRGGQAGSYRGKWAFSLTPILQQGERSTLSAITAWAST
jgi:uncharacterized protein YegP (UPF0339 family)